MEELFEGILEMVLGFLEYRFESIQNPVLRFLAQALSIIGAFALAFTVFLGIYWLITQ